MSEGNGGNIQSIGVQKFNMATIVSQYYVEYEQKTHFTELLPFPQGGLVGDIELSFTIIPPKESKRPKSVGRIPVNPPVAQNPPPPVV